MHQYVYSAHIIEVLDGDTVRADVKLGFFFRAEMTFRLFGMNAPEIRGPEKQDGLRSKAALSDLILDKDVIVKSYKDKPDKYGGRWVAEIFLTEAEGDPSVNQWMIANGYAVKYLP
ncbi:thermonuclease family protein [Patescibacteria group bacterium]|nr:MAG: thermonuclease family protein [Patescibacteria group bacterium]